MKVITHDDFNEVYTVEPAAEPGRIEAILEAIRDEVTLEEALPAGWDDIEAVHSARHIEAVTRMKLYRIAALAAGATMQAAECGMTESCFALVRPPGHHAHEDHCWGFCYFNNVAIALEHLRRTDRIETAYVLDFDMHYGDGTASILLPRGYATIHNPKGHMREPYLREVAARLTEAQADIIAVSAGFDNHMNDWGGVLATDDYRTIGLMVGETCDRLGVGCFAALEGGYNQKVLGRNVRAFLQGLQGLDGGGA